MSAVSMGDTVRFHYTTKLENGAELDSSRSGDPMQVTLGEGRIIAGLETALVGMAAGDAKTVTIRAEDAYGPHHAEFVRVVDRSMIPANIELEVGKVLQAGASDAEQIDLTITEVAEGTVTLDANHPLAGKDLVFDLEMVEIL
ncbi:MAG: peptidylprolyl isomerase [Kiloniellales bacterium]|nr:peptidylprolyl isomerase [Kiloniellales bacterium]